MITLIHKARFTNRDACWPKYEPIPQPSKLRMPPLPLTEACSGQPLDLQEGGVTSSCPLPPCSLPTPYGSSSFSCGQRGKKTELSDLTNKSTGWVALSWLVWPMILLTLSPIGCICSVLFFNSLGFPSLRTPHLWDSGWAEGVVFPLPGLLSASAPWLTSGIKMVPAWPLLPCSNRLRTWWLISMQQQSNSSPLMSPCRFPTV